MKYDFSNIGKRWTADDMEDLMRLYEEDSTWGQIGRALKRSVPSCVMRLRAIRFYSKLPKNMWDARPVYKLQQLECKRRN